MNKSSHSERDNRRWLVVALPVIVLLLLIGWRLKLKAGDAAQQAEMMALRRSMAPLVTVAPVRVKDVVQTFEGVGNVESKLNVKIASKVSGRLDYLQVREGDRVKAGQVLARIDPTEIEAMLRQKMAALAEAQSRLAQAKINQNPTNTGVTTNIRQQAAALNSAQADYNQASKNLSSQIAAATAAVTEAEGKVSAAQAAIASADAVVNSAKANLANATSRLTRITDLYKQGFVAAQDVDDAKTTLSVQQGAVDVAAEQRKAAVAQRDAAQAQQRATEKQLQITRTKAQADVEAAKAKVSQAEAALDYAKANAAQTPAYAQNIAALQAAVAAAQADVAAARAQRADTILKSPLDGYVTGRYMDPGAMATPAQPILSVQSVNTLWVSVPVSEEASRSVYPGVPAQVSLDALPGRDFPGKVVQFNPSADPMSRQFTARVAIENPGNLIKPGMFARVTMTAQRIPKAIVVPREAIQKTKTGSLVMVVDAEDTAHGQTVSLGASDAADVAITNGLEPGQRVIVLSAQPVKDGQKVRTGNQRPTGKSSQEGASR
ncbi:MAG: efflux RND transporter periplasmic adaptor subunit [Armatimonadetes bacterium]|nr:efflux RND transporter periplasmic adaptor subunit [Armatimonadota bacterium]